MESGMEEVFSIEEIDFDYEFDAAKFYDFTRPESDFEVQKAELWFASAPSYPLSPFVLSETLDDCNPVEGESSSFIREADENRIGVGSESNTCSSGHNVAKAKSELPVATKSPSFMKPTASHLAKKNYPQQIQCDRLLRRIQRVNSWTSSAIGNQATKRQKLEAGYLSKVDHQRQLALLLHKVPKKARLAETNTRLSGLKVTIPKGPNLETASRADRHRSRVTEESIEETELKNRKILEVPSSQFYRNRTFQPTKFQALQLRTSERATQQASVNAMSKSPCSSSNLLTSTRDSISVSSVTTRKEKLEPLETFTACCLNHMEPHSPTAKRSLHDPMIESLNKLSLESKDNPMFQSKLPLHSTASNENEPAGALNHEKSDVAKSQRLGGSPYNCGTDRRLPSIGAIFNLNRSFDIR